MFFDVYSIGLSETYPGVSLSMVQITSQLLCPINMHWGESPHPPQHTLHMRDERG